MSKDRSSGPKETKPDDDHADQGRQAERPAVYEENLSGWQQALSDHGIAIRVEAEDDRLASIRRLIASGLPTYEYTFIPCAAYLTPDARLHAYYRSLPGHIVARACPLRPGLQRYTFVGKTLDETVAALADRISPADVDAYTVVLNEYEPAAYAGVIISDRKGTCIEMVAEPNLENLCHGHVVPWSARFADDDVLPYRRMRFSDDAPEPVRKRMWAILRGICARRDDNGSIPSYEPERGYFEFVITPQGATKFIDYAPMR